MKVTIIRPENAVIVDGVAFKVDCRSLPAYISVVQFEGEEGDDASWPGAGWLQFAQDHRQQFLPNLPIASLKGYGDHLVEDWRKVKASADAMAAADHEARQDGAQALTALHG